MKKTKLLQKKENNERKNKGRQVKESNQGWKRLGKNGRKWEKIRITHESWRWWVEDEEKETKKNNWRENIEG